VADRRTFHLRCDCCGWSGEREIDVETVRKTATGTLGLIECAQCDRIAARPTIRPWALTWNDRQFLKGLLIASVEP
jgi:hypothetical protein